MKAILPLLLLGVVSLAGCRGWRSGEAPIHPNLNMDFTQRFEEQEPNAFFADGKASRMPVAGTVKRGGLRTAANAPFTQGRTADGAYVATIPMAVTSAVVARGQAKYNTYCGMCHGPAGDGKGIIMVGKGGTGYGYTPAPTYHDDRLRGVADGYLYDVISNGVRNMSGYGQQIAIPDRWAIVAYLRALQLSQNASAEALPTAELDRLRAETPAVTPTVAN